MSEATGEAPSEAEAPASTQPEVREPLAPPFQAAKIESVQAAIEKVTLIISDLRNVLNDMELVLEYLEDVERQQTADEREIDNLQRRLNMIHRRVDRHPSEQRAPQRPHDDAAEAAG